MYWVNKRSKQQRANKIRMEERKKERAKHTHNSEQNNTNEREVSK